MATIRTLHLQEATSIVQSTLTNLRNVPAIAAARLGPMRPVYSPRGDAAYFEAELAQAGGAPSGHMLVSATTATLPVLEIAPKGKSYHQRFRERLGHDRFRVVWFSPDYAVAEDDHGARLAEIGIPPTPVPPALQRHVRNEARGQSFVASSHALSRPDVWLAAPTGPVRPVSAAAYADLKARYRAFTVRPDRLERAWARALPTPGGTARGASCSYSITWADGNADHPHFLQIPKHTGPNHNDHWSGCGPTAWMNLYGWHDKYWSPALLSGTPMVNDSTIDGLTMQCHDYIGTYEPWWLFDTDQGFTWPDDMARGLDFARTVLHHDCSYFWREDWWNTDENWVFEVARSMMASRRPFIVGYYEDWHYAIGMAIAQCTTHGWQDHSWIWIYPAWSRDESDNKWIPKETIFGIYGVYGFRSLREVVSLEGAHETRLQVLGPGDADTLRIFSGTAVCPPLRGTGGSWYRDHISFELGPAYGDGALRGTAARVALASVRNANTAVNAGWAVDRWHVERNPATGRLRVTVDYAVSDSDGYLLRLEYRVHALSNS